MRRPHWSHSFGREQILVNDATMRTVSLKNTISASAVATRISRTPSLSMSYRSGEACRKDLWWPPKSGDLCPLAPSTTCQDMLCQSAQAAGVYGLQSNSAPCMMCLTVRSIMTASCCWCFLRFQCTDRHTTTCTLDQLLLVSCLRERFTQGLEECTWLLSNLIDRNLRPHHNARRASQRHA